MPISLDLWINSMKKCKTGDIISITLDLIQQSVIFHNSRTDTSQGVKLTNPEETVEYRLVVIIHDCGTSICICDFEQEFAQ